MGRIANIPVLERPYEKLKFFGPESLSDSELLSIIIGTGTKEMSSLDISQEIISKNNGLKFLEDYSLEQLKQLNGIGETKAIRMKAIAEIAIRINKPRLNKYKITKREEAVNLATELKSRKTEALKIILLNNQNIVLRDKIIAVGSESNVAINIKTILNEAIRSFAPKIILIHNHPSRKP